MRKKNIIQKSADAIRMLSAAMVEKAKSGHPGGAMGGADFINILYSEFLNYDPDDGNWNLRDRFFLDPGHMSPMLYSVLSLAGFIPEDELKRFRQWGSLTPGHPEKDFTLGIENTSGPLGMGHAMAVGSAIAERFMCERFGEWMAHKTFTFISDGGIQEEISQGAGRIAGHLGLSNLIMFYDSNDIQLSTIREEVTSEDTAKKYEAWGWRVLTINGNEANDIRWALSAAIEEKERPVLIIGKTVMGKGILNDLGDSFEGKISTHGQPISSAGGSFERTILNLGGVPNNPFEVKESIKRHWESVAHKKKEYVKSKNNIMRIWKETNPELNKKLRGFLSMDLSHVNFDDIIQKKDSSTRGASGIVLEYLSQNVENIIVTSADLSNSDKTDGFLKHSKAFSKNDFSGKFLQAGVAELTMAAISNGIALHGGIIPVCATFFVFSDYMKPAVRLAALMELPVKYLWTHDSFRVGEDGPTHQPIEHEAQIRLLERLKNHSGDNSMLVLRPADSDETTSCWEIALKNDKTPSALLLSRQNITSISTFSLDNSKKTDRGEIEKGAYIVYQTSENPDLILFGNGSEVSLLLEAIPLIENESNISVRVVSIPTVGLYLTQDISYRDTIIPSDKLKFGLTSGLTDVFLPITNKEDEVYGMTEFGHSAPANILDEKLGFVKENIVRQLNNLIDKKAQVARVDNY